MITRLRNSNLIRAPYVRIMKTKLNISIIKVLVHEGFVNAPFSAINENSNSDYLIVGLKYKSIKGDPYITNIKRVSTCGQRVYSKSKNIPRVLGGMGVAVRLQNFFFVQESFRFFCF